MTNLFFNLLFFIIELSKLMMLQFGIFRIKSRTPKTMLTVGAVSCILAGALSVWAYHSLYSLIVGLLSIAAVCVMTVEKKKYVAAILGYLYIVIMDIVLLGICVSLFDINLNSVIENRFEYLLMNSLSLIMLLPLMIHNIRKRNELKNGLSNRTTVLLIAGGIAVGLFFGAIQLSASDSFNGNIMRVVILGVSLSCLFFVFICEALISNKAQNHKLKKANAEANQLMKIQEKYYTILLKRENETRAFRHDIKSHLYCLKTLYSEGKYEEFEDYLSNLTTSLNEIVTSTETGNNLINAIVNDIASQYSDVTLNWHGYLPMELSLSSMDLCTVFSNLLRNAFEAAVKTEEKDVSVSVRNIGSSLILEVSNTSLTEPVKHNGKFVSSKSEGGHGYGISNAKKVIESKNGSFLMNYENGIVRTEVILPSAIKVENAMQPV
ncbi:MAG TPA: GHKL domain-containing protein [Ruminococcus sp.]|nr:GHKL domain-containing protein [Ruminococcus sp.]